MTERVHRRAAHFDSRVPEHSTVRQCVHSNGAVQCMYARGGKETVDAFHASKVLGQLALWFYRPVHTALGCAQVVLEQRQVCPIAKQAVKPEFGY